MLKLLSLAVLLTAIYYAIIPSESIHLGSLEKIQSQEYPADVFDENGFVELSHGKTKFYFIGPKEGKRVLFIHGIGSTAPLMKMFLNSLGDKGYRVLAFDLYGRGHSDSPGVR
jgi:pimeloyl-ACP methyl ester carboxylesterase